MEVIVDNRWDGHEDDHSIYNEIFDEAVLEIANGDDKVGALLMSIINEWEKSPRAIPMPVLNRAYEYVLEQQRMRELSDRIDEILPDMEMS